MPEAHAGQHSDLMFLKPFLLGALIGLVQGEVDMREYEYLKYPAFTIYVVKDDARLMSWLVSVTCMLILLSPLFRSVGRQCHYTAGPGGWDGGGGEGMPVC